MCNTNRIYVYFLAVTIDKNISMESKEMCYNGFTVAFGLGDLQTVKNILAEAIKGSGTLVMEKLESEGKSQRCVPKDNIGRMY